MVLECFVFVAIGCRTKRVALQPRCTSTCTLYRVKLSLRTDWPFQHPDWPPWFASFRRSPAPLYDTLNLIYNGAA